MSHRIQYIKIGRRPEFLAFKLYLFFSGAVSVWGEKLLISGGQSPVYSPGTGHTWSACQESVWIIQLQGMANYFRFI